MRAPEPDELPTLSQLQVATVVALLVSAVLTFTVILPAEAGIDPTGLGRVLGLTPLGELKTALDAPAAPVEPFAHTAEQTVRLKPGAGTEVKARLRKGDQIVFSWEASETVFFDFHGEPAENPEDFVSYDKGTHYRKRLVPFEATFTGTHGWYWKNVSEAPAEVRVEVSGVFADLRQR
jgi:hypothetical protein